jgi:2-polyprenyl-3-methyl-5-hydroxy-6-metoxy-1,4-benzoquinol methylase
VSSRGGSRAASDYGISHILVHKHNTVNYNHSDPVLWAFTGAVSGLTALDSGCGTGYWPKKLRDHRALVTGIDFSESMIAMARGRNPEVHFREGSCAELAPRSSALHLGK